MAYTPLPYKSYQAIVTQTGTSAPSAAVKQNNIHPSITWSRTSAGLYKMTASSPVFESGKTVVILSSPNSGLTSYTALATGSTTVITIQTLVTSLIAAVLSVTGTDGIMNAMLVEVRVYY